MDCTFPASGKAFFFSAKNLYNFNAQFSPFCGQFSCLFLRGPATMEAVRKECRSRRQESAASRLALKIGQAPPGAEADLRAARAKRFVFHNSCIGCGKRNAFYNAALHCNFAVLLKLAKGSPFERLPPAGGRCRVSDRGRRSWQCGALTERATSYGWKRPARPATRQAARRQGTWAHPAAAGSGCPGSGGRCRAQPPRSGHPPAHPADSAARR